MRDRKGITCFPRALWAPRPQQGNEYQGAALRAGQTWVRKGSSGVAYAWGERQGWDWSRQIQGQAQVPGKERIPQGQDILLLSHSPPAGLLSSTRVTKAQDHLWDSGGESWSPSLQSGHQHASLRSLGGMLSSWQVRPMIDTFGLIHGSPCSGHNVHTYPIVVVLFPTKDANNKGPHIKCTKI